MNTRQPRYSKEEHARRGDDIYERHVRPHVEAGNLGKIVAIDVDTGAFEVAEDTLTASQRLLTRYPDAQIWCIRIGHRGDHRFGCYPGVAAETMITGIVNANREAIIHLMVLGPQGHQQEIEAVIDTGFTGFLTLPPLLVTTLGLD